MTMPDWWSWEPASKYVHPVSARSAVAPDGCDWVACTVRVPRRGWAFMIADKRMECECAGYPTEAAAKRACERVWMAYQ